MLQQDFLTRVSAVIEEELGALRAFSDLPSTELESMASRITRAIEPYLDSAELFPESQAA